MRAQFPRRTQNGNCRTRAKGQREGGCRTREREDQRAIRLSEGTPGGWGGGESMERDRGQKNPIQLSTHPHITNTVLRTKTGPPETVSTPSFHVRKQQLEDPSLAWGGVA